MLEAFKVHNADFLLVAATDAAGGAAAIMIAATGALARFDQALLRLGFSNVAVIGIGDITRGWRQRSKRFYWHKFNFPRTKSATWRAEPSFLPSEKRSVIGSAGNAVRAPT